MNAIKMVTNAKKSNNLPNLNSLSFIVSF